jgi:hypothetical protein
VLDTPPGVSKIIGKIVTLTQKPTEGNKKIRTALQLKEHDGVDLVWLSTLDGEIGNAAKRLFDGGDIVEAWFVRNGEWLNLTDISAAVFEK